MTLKDVLQEFLNKVGWKDEIQHDDAGNTNWIITDFPIRSQNYRLKLLADEPREQLTIFLISPISIPKHRAKEAAFVLNFINANLALGDLVLEEDGMVLYQWVIDVGGATAAPHQIATLINAAAGAFDEMRVAAIGAAAFSKQPAEEIVDDYKKALFELIKKMQNEKAKEAPSSL